MAVLLTAHFGPATQGEFNDLDDLIGEAMMKAGGPPAGMMAVVVHPSGDGFAVAQVWRSESEGRAYLTDTLSPLAAKLGFQARETETQPVWSFARP